MFPSFRRLLLPVAVFVRGNCLVDFAPFLSDRLGAPSGTSGGWGTLLLEEEGIRGVECEVFIQLNCPPGFGGQTAAVDKIRRSGNFSPVARLDPLTPYNQGVSSTRQTLHPCHGCDSTTPS